jgi:hypothetical protein
MKAGGITADLAVMCARAEGGKNKPSTRRTLARSDFLYRSSFTASAAEARRQFEDFCAGVTLPIDLRSLRIITRADLRMLLTKVYQPRKAMTSIMSLPSTAMVIGD